MDLTPTEQCELSVAAYAIGALEISRRLALSSAADLRKQGRLGTLIAATSAAASASVSMGDTVTALPLAAECIALAEKAGDTVWVLGTHLVLALAEALHGDIAAARGRVDTVEQVLIVGRRLTLLSIGQRARGIAALVEGRPDEAFRQMMRVFDPSDHAYAPFYQFHILGDLAEAALLGGLLDELRPVVADLEPIAARSCSPSLRVGLGYARAVLAGDYETALAEDLIDWLFARARLQLTYGASLRRAFQVTASRPLLRAAETTFDRLGATPWADRARSELRATGETRRKPMDAMTAPTPQEQQIARLAAEGLSNREIGERLFLSPRTVSTHLYRIYPKINVRSRVELARIITSSDIV